MESVRSIMTARRFTDSAEPEPFSPRLTSFSRGVLPKTICMICGPFAPILPSNNAPPIHKAKGPKIPMRPSMKKFETIPSSFTFISSQVSMTASIPNKNAVQCNQRFGCAFAVVLRTPSSISSSMNSLARLRPKIKASPSVVTAVKMVAPTLRVGVTSKSPVRNSIKPTAERTIGTETKARRYPASHATEDMTKSSSKTIPCKL